MHALIMVLLAVNATGQTPATGDKPPEKIFSVRCSSCHGKDGKGSIEKAKMLGVQPKVLDLTSDALSKKPDVDIIDEINGGGKRIAPSFKGKFTDTEMTALVKYIRSLNKKSAPAAKSN